MSISVYFFFYFCFRCCTVYFKRGYISGLRIPSRIAESLQEGQMTTWELIIKRKEKNAREDKVGEDSECSKGIRKRGGLQ